MKRLLASPRLRLLLALAFLAAATVVATVADVPSAGEIRSWIDSSGLAAPLLFILLYLVLAVLFFPGSVLTAAGGALFGVAAGTVLSVIGATAGATAAFFIARRLGRQTLERAAGRRVRIVDAWLGRRGFTAVLYLRLFPIVPFNAMNYASGFRESPVMEDYDFARRLTRRGRVACLGGPARTSSRRWRRMGVVRTVLA